MMTETEYLYGWGYYLLGAILLIGCWWFLTAKIRATEVRQLLRVIVPVAILTPWYTNAEQPYLSPALLISIVETLVDGGQAFWRAGTPLIFAVLVSLLCSGLYQGIRWYLQRNKMKNSAA
ncbi:hypothetical protein [Teredinibacter waterburyi]|uniref:hypothetical protein n=1 Tax=Teredinibacter waterburyi TaxID=1500538 RepID=UPI00165ECF85|nr:hypothetical protein [Teredinibacter waterburyi]